MKPRREPRGLLEKKLLDPVYRRRFNEGFSAFELEVQVLNALERRGMTYTDLARLLHTSKSNISRDLSAGGINSATVARVARIGEALGMTFFPILVPKEQEQRFVAVLQRLLGSEA